MPNLAGSSLNVDSIKTVIELEKKKKVALKSDMNRPALPPKSSSRELKTMQGKKVSEKIHSPKSQ